jgi:hypothetical protein
MWQPREPLLIVVDASFILDRRARLACHVDNVASRRVAEKCGFVLVSSLLAATPS